MNIIQNYISENILSNNNTILNNINIDIDIIKQDDFITIIKFILKHKLICFIKQNTINNIFTYSTDKTTKYSKEQYNINKLDVNVQDNIQYNNNNNNNKHIINDYLQSKYWLENKLQYDINLILSCESSVDIQNLIKQYIDKHLSITDINDIINNYYEYLYNLKK